MNQQQQQYYIAPQGQYLMGNSPIDPHRQQYFLTPDGQYVMVHPPPVSYTQENSSYRPYIMSPAQYGVQSPSNMGLYDQVIMSIPPQQGMSIPPQQGRSVLSPVTSYANIQPRPPAQYNQQPQFEPQHQPTVQSYPQLQFQPIQPQPAKTKPVAPRPIKPVTIDDTHDNASSDSDDSDSESESDDDDSPPEQSPIPPMRPTDAVEGLKFDTIKAVWAPRNKKASISTIRKAIMAYSDIVKAVRDTWKVRNEALKVAEQNADDDKLPLLRSEVASHRHVIDMVIMAAYDYGHPSAVHRFGEHLIIMSAFYSFLLDRHMAGDNDGRLTINILKMMARFATVDRKKLEQTKNDKILVRFVKKAGNEAKTLAQQILDNASQVTKMKAEREKAKSAATANNGASGTTTKETKDAAAPNAESSTIKAAGPKPSTSSNVAKDAQRPMKPSPSSQSENSPTPATVAGVKRERDRETDRSEVPSKRVVSAPGSTRTAAPSGIGANRISGGAAVSRRAGSVNAIARNGGTKTMGTGAAVPGGNTSSITTITATTTAPPASSAPLGSTSTASSTTAGANTAAPASANGPKTAIPAKPPLNLFGGLTSASKKPGTSNAARAAAAKDRTRSESSGSESRSAPSFSFAETMANLSRPKDDRRSDRSTEASERTFESEAERESHLRKQKRARLRVNWKPDPELVEVRVFSHDPAEIQRDAKPSKDVEDIAGEGRMLKLHLGDQDLDDDDDEPSGMGGLILREKDLAPYNALLLVDFTVLPAKELDENYYKHGGNRMPDSLAKAAQDKREADSLPPLYVSPSDKPYSPKEPPQDPKEDEALSQEPVPFGEPSEIVGIRSNIYFTNQTAQATTHDTPVSTQAPATSGVSTPPAFQPAAPTAAPTAGGVDFSNLIHILQSAANLTQQQQQQQQHTQATPSHQPELENTANQFPGSMHQYSPQPAFDLQKILAAVNGTTTGTTPAPPQQQPQQTAAPSMASLLAQLSLPQHQSQQQIPIRQQQAQSPFTPAPLPLQQAPPPPQQQIQGDGDRKRMREDGGGVPGSGKNRNKRSKKKHGKGSVQCRYFKEGSCLKGDECTFRH